ncbi:MAG: hypothetical protein KDD47_03455, partial [Acidobacteria bacterium]|nr:hypothetical protein [Acidobacteriota bacterium]
RLAVGGSGAPPDLPTVLPGEDTPVVPLPEDLGQPVETFSAVTAADGSFSIPDVPAILGSLKARASATTPDAELNGRSAAVEPLPGGVTDLGQIRVSDFSTLYGSAFLGPNGPSTLYEIDPETGVATLIGSIGFLRVGAMDFSEDGKLYAVGRDPVSRENVFLTIDPATGAGSEIGPTGVETLGFGDTISDISFRPSDGVLFAYLEAGDGLGVIDLATGAVTALGPTRVSCCGNGIAFAADDRLLHVNEDSLHFLDQASGEATEILPMSYPGEFFFPRVNSMDFRPDTEELFAFLVGDFGGTPIFLVRVDPTTGAVTVVGGQTVNGLDAIAWGPPR